MLDDLTIDVQDAVAAGRPLPLEWAVRCAAVDEVARAWADPRLCFSSAAWLLEALGLVDDSLRRQFDTQFEARMTEELQDGGRPMSRVHRVHRVSGKACRGGLCRECGALLRRHRRSLAFRDVVEAVEQMGKRAKGPNRT